MITIEEAVSLAASVYKTAEYDAWIRAIGKHFGCGWYWADEAVRQAINRSR